MYVRKKRGWQCVQLKSVKKFLILYGVYANSRLQRRTKKRLLIIKCKSIIFVNNKSDNQGEILFWKYIKQDKKNHLSLKITLMTKLYFFDFSRQ